MLEEQSIIDLETASLDELSQAIERGENARKQEIHRDKLYGQKAHTIIKKVTPVLEMAVALSIFDDPVKASKLAGLSLTESEAKELAKDARANHQNIIDLNPQGWMSLSHYVKFQLLIRMLKTAPMMSPRDLANAIKAITSADEMIAGKSQTIFSEIILNLGFESDPDDEPSEENGSIEK